MGPTSHCAAARSGGSVEDSSFNVEITFSGGSCEQKLDVAAVVTAFPDISPIINLRAYAQRTPFVPVPDNEIYFFGDGSRTILKSKDGKEGPYPPTKGDIWIDVADTSSSAAPPQEPILKLANPDLLVKLWKSNYLEADFSNVAKLVTEFAADPAYDSGYGPGPITGINVGDVYAFKFSESLYALIYIRRVDDGSENTSSKQSGVEFRAVYPIIVY